MTDLQRFVAAEIERPVSREIAEAGRAVAARLGGCAVLFYGSVLRTGDLDGVLDFYVLRGDEARPGVVAACLWPDVSYHEVAVNGRTIRAKVASMQLATFARAVRGDMLDTTIWARFVQPVALIWADNAATRQRVAAAICDAAVTAAGFAALHGPRRGAAGDFWRALFRATYRTELRVEAPGREDQILSYDRRRYDELLPLAWTAGGLAFAGDGTRLAPCPTEAQLRALARSWMPSEATGKWLNLARLAKAAFTFEGAARYALWKVERHTGLRIPLTPFRERHPILAAPGVLCRVWRRSAAQ
ncbi:hypothetical protein [Sphingomonas aracearum]|uniref:Uncharacterized protein n=1 Tax=Sphingomonas aracearum TaxID=2283317 RepID=A0A369VTF0_9SPHN|nr:hypothetical protein [Sphingomonas aracearum]RDE05684.1 hypothetical protein DVW87_10755 [Sphingomonas aracearum]